MKKNYDVSSKKAVKNPYTAKLKYVYVKDSEGYVFKKPKSDVCKGEKIISEKAYLKASGLADLMKKDISSEKTNAIKASIKGNRPLEKSKSTFERIMSDPKQKKAFEREYADFLLSDSKIQR